MKAKDIMTKDVVFVAPEARIVEVADLLFKNGFHGLPVVEDEKVIGIITENDFFIKDTGTLFLPSYINFLKETRVIDDLPSEKKKKIKKLLSLTARDIMTADPVTIAPEMEISDLLEFIKKTRFNTLPVTNENKNILGLVTLVDVIGMVKQTRSGDNAMKGRDVEDLTKDVHSWWRKSFVFIAKTHIRTWKGIFIIAFAAGAAAALIWTVSIRIQSESGASTNLPGLALHSDDETVASGDLFNVDIMMNTGDQKAIAVQADIKYNPQDFQLEIWDTQDSVMASSDSCVYRNQPCQIIKNNPDAGEISIFLAKPSGGTITSNGKIANIVFRALQEDSSITPNIEINLANSGIYRNSFFILGSGQGSNILNSVNNLLIQVTSTPQ